MCGILRRNYFKGGGGGGGGGGGMCVACKRLRIAGG